MFDAFQLFDKLEYSTGPSTDAPPPPCPHDRVLTNNQGYEVCAACGVEMNQELNYDREWVSYEPRSASYASTAERCHARRVSTRTILTDLADKPISTRIKNLADEIYAEVCKHELHRSSCRVGIVFASVFSAYKLDNNPQSCDKLLTMFKISRKDALNGIKFINARISKTSPMRRVYITPEHLINEYLTLFDVSEGSHADILDLYERVRNRSTVINRSRPQSVASGVIWYWIKTNAHQHITIKEFIHKVRLSELTINKITKEIDKLLNRSPSQ